ncbi:MAG: NAD(P)-dependent oxidoreductase [candidate division Zixibacteria bacterium]|nr:NAD(P)-dependent oxidoreductase [candidate division Zixibacteria bacterium]
MKRILVFGASGNVGPHVVPFLEPFYEVHLADIKPHPFGKPVRRVDMTSYEQVFDAMEGMDGGINFTVLRDDPVVSFEVNVKGAYHMMRAAAALGIHRVVHTAAQSARYWFDNDFDVDHIPEWLGTGYYMLTKYLSQEICRTYARTFGIQTVCFLFNGLGPKPTGPVKGDFPPFTVIWEDLAHACRLALGRESIADDFQYFNLHSHIGQGKYAIDKTRRLLGYEPLERWEAYFRREVEKTA